MILMFLNLKYYPQDTYSYMKKLVFAFIFILTLNCFAQYKTGVKYFESFQYSKAIPCLKKAANKNNADKMDATVKLADCYRYIKDYKNAELYYQKAIELGSTEAIVHYNYGLVLKNNNKYDEALKQLTLFLAANPTDAKAKNAVKSFNDIKAWQSLPKEYEITNIDKVNSKKSEFCPVVYEGKLFYTTWQINDLVNYEKFDYDGTPFLNIYYNVINDGVNFSHRKNFSKKINTQYHDGPISFSKQNEIYFTRVNYIKQKKDKAFVNRPQLFIAVKKGKGWSKAQVFPYNNTDYSIAHASISDDGNYLFFSSDMPGGAGGMDIWVCKKNSTGWDKPQNLGTDINTPGNEEFPFIRNDEMLFFSSDGLPGFGGLDIFSAKQIADKWILNRNEGVGMNSLADDFGVFFTDNTKGYISSNRDGGKGGDDIYQFTFTQKLITLDGTILNSKDAGDFAKDVKILLEDNQGNRIKDTRTNNEGYFKFDNLSSENKYMVKVDENDASFKQQKRFFYRNSAGEVVRVTVINDKGEKYVFRNLPSDAGALPELNSPEDVTLAGNLLYGENPALPIANKKIVLKDNKGNIVDEAFTNAFGAFVFTKIPSDENYSISMAENDASIPRNSKVIITNRNGKQVRVLKADGKGSFVYDLLASDKNAMNDLKVEDADLLMNIAGKIVGPNKAPLKHVKVFLLNGKVTLLDTSITDDEGVFRFDKLRSAGDYILNIDENEGQLKDLEKIYITDLKNKVIREIYRNRHKGFSFNLLQSDKSTLKDMYVEDPWLDVLSLKNKTNEITIIENVYYALNAYKFDDAGQRIMDKVIQVMNSNKNINIEISSHTDSQGDDKNNLLLSQKRAKFAVDYMISKGVDAKRLKAIGYGETKLLNQCNNGVICTPEEHAKNRRAEFKIIDTSKK
jgi:outer membrane protein OmpA-like peptidoglycan-associated protein/tetratricopeptide (TPR) repeat protein